MLFSIVLASIAFTLGADGETTPNAVNNDSIQAKIAEVIATLPGEKAFLFASLDKEGPKPIYAVNADKRLAVGSTFKLFILGELAREVNAGRRRFDDTMLLRADCIGPPHSEMADWPLGSPVTLHTLALKMISISDNTATDHLLYLVDPRNVEHQMKAMGHGDPAVNTPFMSTRQMTMLRNKNADLPVKEYPKFETQKKRLLLEKLAKGPSNYANVDFDTSAYDVAEWYASPTDMARALNWIRLNTERDDLAAPIRGILAVETKLPHEAKYWHYVGFKGGSEDQLLAGNWLLEYRDHTWYTFHVYCNNPTGKVDPEVMLAAIHKVFGLINEGFRDGGE